MTEYSDLSENNQYSDDPENCYYNASKKVDTHKKFTLASTTRKKK